MKPAIRTSHRPAEVYHSLQFPHTLGPFLAGDFHYRRHFGGMFRDFTPPARYRLAQEMIRPLMCLPDVPVPPLKGEVALHFRAGDVFGSHPQPNYGQPPLSFYQSAVTQLVAKGVNRASLVYEDRGNPCIAAMEHWLDQIGMPWRTQSATVEEDVAFLLQADHLVFGTGTFGMGICLLSGPVATVHAFDGWGLYDGLPNIAELTLCKDEAGAYIPPSGWRNTPDQRQLMLDYPASGIAFRKA
jgi:hypothetical protein